MRGSLRAVRKIFGSLVLTGWVLVSAFAQSSNFLSLTVTVLAPEQNEKFSRLAFDLCNSSSKTQEFVIPLTNVFPGTVSLLLPNDEVREFVHTNYWNRIMTTYWFRPSVVLRPKQCLRFETSTADFIDPERPSPLRHPRKLPASIAPDFPTLASELRLGCWLSSRVEIQRQKHLPGGYVTNVDIGSIVSPQIRYVK